MLHPFLIGILSRSRRFGILFRPLPHRPFDFAVLSIAVIIGCRQIFRRCILTD